MNNRSVILFGASGFIGTYLVDDLLVEGCKVTAIDVSDLSKEYFETRGVKFLTMDITDRKQFEDISGHYDCAILLAAMQPANFSALNNTNADYIDVNVKGTVNVLDFCLKNGIGRIVYGTSHRNTSGLWRVGKPVSEEDGINIQYSGEYAMFCISETAAQHCLNHYHEEFGIEAAIMRLPPVYGYGPHLEIFKEGKAEKTGFQTFIDNAIAGIPLEVWGDPDVGRDIIYVKDVTRAFTNAAIMPNVNGLFNISTGRKLTLREEVETIAKVFWRKGEVPIINYRPEKKHKMDSFVYDNTKAKKILNWKPVFTFEDLLIDYQKERLNNRYVHLIERRQMLFKNG